MDPTDYTPIVFRSFQVPKGLAGLRQEVRDFLRQELDAGTFVPRCDAWLSGHSPEFSRKLARRGWLGMTWPRRYGGWERSPFERFVVVEELLAAGAPVAAHWIADRQSGPLLLRYGTEEQRDRFLPPIARGECFFAIGMSEPDAGSDLAAVRTSAERTEDGWRVTGNKVWTSHAHRSHYMIMLCRTSKPDPQRRHHGLTQMIADLESPGLQIRPIQVTTGEHHFNEVVMDGIRVPDSMVVGQVGDGWRQVMAELAYERSGPERFMSTYPLFSEMVGASRESSERMVAAAVGQVVARLWSVRRLAMSVTGMLAAGEDAALQAALAKELGTRVESEIADTARLIGGLEPAVASSERVQSLLSEAILASPGFTLRGGTSEILRGVVAGGLGE